VARIVFRLAQDQWAESARSAQAPLTGNEPAPADEGNPLQAIEDDERRSAVWQAIDGLTGAERAAVLLYYREETSVEDTARVLGVTPGTVKTLLHRGRTKLRARLKEFQ
jgi:RNA polymerase sigma factor (sigma-70 family)